MIRAYRSSPPARQAPDAYLRCGHRSRVVVCRIYRNGTRHFIEYCVDCVERLRELPYAEVTPDLEKRVATFGPDEWKARQRLLFDVRSRHWATARAQHDSAWWAWYQEYLASDVWASKRERVLERAKGACEACGIEQATQVHHVTYKRVGREPLFDLRAVCISCHEDLHR